MGKKDDEIARLIGVVKQKNELIDGVKKDVRKVDNHNSLLKRENDRLTRELQAALKKKSLLGVRVDITGIEEKDAITATLDKAKNVVVDRLKALKRDVDFDVLAHPHTLDIKLIR